ncbi:prolyl oligopeptidase family serine peptidase [Hyphobacterium marinum]|uniref:Prolyl oligopeptidase family serine peptidase n=1 Tax=Hyphobacterium marinum TaxID=3116574 RepID=A0ABU7LVE7_9PROT|nr:prolyl oligopeptidase family serine peptidase [Hyphobacterium sp. Y6023]MEE2565533.1 prolyl oligopeptidase family serine peptidase [Hyphobacterium sp. Y6023]
MSQTYHSVEFSTMTFHRHWLAAAAVCVLAAACSAPETDEDTSADMDTAADMDTGTEEPVREIVEIDPENDPRLWLEEVDGERALEWARGQNERTFARLQDDPRYDGFYNAALEIYQSNDRIAYGAYQGGFVYNFWQDSTNTHGLWRRTTLDSYLSDAPEWDVILDLDALSEEEDVNWVWRGANCLGPDYNRCIITLSDGGRDAAHRREFDIEARSFVEDGFVTPEAKGGISWIDENTVMVGLATGGEESTESGYPVAAYRWERGTAFEDATEVLRGDLTDVGLWGFRVEDNHGTTFMMASEADTFFETTWWILPDGAEPVSLPIPARSSIQDFFDGQLIISLEEEWTHGQETFPQGALLSFDLAAFVDSGEIATVNTVFVPNDRQSIGGVGATQSTLLVQIDENVTGGLQAFTRGEDGLWSSETIATPENLTLGLTGTSVHHDVAFLNVEGFLTPDSLYVVDVENRSVEVAKSTPERFDADGLVVEQFEAESPDGTMVPYFVVRHEDTVMDGTTPTLLYAYGGFQVTIAPSYSGVRGRLWLENGGAYVVANIRGGGEFGPAWHQAGLKMNRQRIYDDLIAVAEDMIDTGLTSPRHLGVYGGSNGGLLTGVMYTQRPDLWNAVVSAVPLLDMLRFDQLLAGASWVGEYGSPSDPDEGGFLRSISPYHNVDANGDYPEIYLYTSTADDRVHPGHARKMAHLLSETGHPYLYYENLSGGHSAAADLPALARRDAMLYVFLTQKLMDDEAPEGSAE